MAATSQSGQSRRGSSSRGRAQATKRAGSSASGSTSKNGTSRTGANSGSGTSKSRSSSSTAAKRATSATKTAASKATPSGGSSNGNQKSSNGQHEALTNLGVSVFSAAVGAVGGALLIRKTKHQHHRKVLGISMPTMPEKVDLSGVANSIGQAGKQFGELAGEVRAVRQKAEQIGRLLS
jgi:hypothetical protein